MKKMQEIHDLMKALNLDNFLAFFERDLFIKDLTWFLIPFEIGFLNFLNRFLLDVD